MDVITVLTLTQKVSNPLQLGAHVLIGDQGRICEVI